MRDLDALREQLWEHVVSFHGLCSCGVRIPDHRNLQNVVNHIARELVAAGFGRVSPYLHAYSVVPGMAMCGEQLVGGTLIPPRYTGYKPARRAMRPQELNVTCEACRARLY